MNLSELITRHLLGIATDDDERRLREWLQASAEHRAEHARLLERLRADLLTEEPADARRAWRAFESQLPTSERRAFTLRRLWRYAGAACVVLAVLAGSIWWLAPRIDDRRVAAIVPGTTRAVLQTGEGEGVEIFPETAEVETAKQGWAMRNEKGVLRYDLPSPADSVHHLLHTLSVPRGGEYTVVLADGTKIYLNAESRLRYPVAFTPADTVRRVWVSGEAYFQVARNESLPFEVHTEHGTVRVYGTKFNVHDYADEHQTVVTLSEGSVGFTVGGREHRLLPGGQLAYDHATGRVEVRQVDAAVYCSWIDGMFEFNGMPLERIMQQLARWYDIDYRFADPQLGRRLFTGIAFRQAPLKELLNQIEKTTQIHFEIEKRIIVISN